MIMHNTIKVLVGVILFGTNYLRESLPSLINQDYPNVTFVLRDQEEGVWSASKFITEEMPEISARAEVIKGDNLMHSGGHNEIFAMYECDYYICASNDMLYPHDMVSVMVDALEREPEYGYATCKIRRWDYGSKSTSSQKTEFIDSYGLEINSWGYAYDQGQGHRDEGQFAHLKEVFGATGALMVFRAQTFKNIGGFDKALHYKNDVDLSFRLNEAGVKCLFVQDVTVYHDRQVSGALARKADWVKQSSALGDRKILKLITSSKRGFLFKAKAFLFYKVKELIRRFI